MNGSIAEAANCTAPLTADGPLCVSLVEAAGGWYLCYGIAHATASAALLHLLLRVAVRNLRSSGWVINADSRIWAPVFAGLCHGLRLLGLTNLNLGRWGDRHVACAIVSTELTTCCGGSAFLVYHRQFRTFAEQLVPIRKLHPAVYTLMHAGLWGAVGALAAIQVTVGKATTARIDSSAWLSSVAIKAVIGTLALVVFVDIAYVTVCLRRRCHSGYMQFRYRLWSCCGLALTLVLFSIFTALEHHSQARNGAPFLPESRADIAITFASELPNTMRLAFSTAMLVIYRRTESEPVDRRLTWVQHVDHLTFYCGTFSLLLFMVAIGFLVPADHFDAVFIATLTAPSMLYGAATCVQIARNAPERPRSEEDVRACIVVAQQKLDHARQAHGRWSVPERWQKVGKETAKVLFSGGFFVSYALQLGKPAGDEGSIFDCLTWLVEIGEVIRWSTSARFYCSLAVLSVYSMSLAFAVVLRALRVPKWVLKLQFESWKILYNYALLSAMRLTVLGLSCKPEASSTEGPARTVLAMDPSIPCDRGYDHRSRAFFTYAFLSISMCCPAVTVTTFVLNKISKPHPRYLPEFSMLRVVTIYVLVMSDLLVPSPYVKVGVGGAIIIGLLVFYVAVQPATGAAGHVNCLQVSILSISAIAYIVSGIRLAFPSMTLLCFGLFVGGTLLVGPTAYFLNRLRACSFDRTSVVQRAVELCTSESLQAFANPATGAVLTPRPGQQLKRAEAPSTLLVAFSCQPSLLQDSKTKIDIAHLYEARDGIDASVRQACQAQLAMMLQLVELESGCVLLRNIGVPKLIVSLVKYELGLCLRILSAFMSKYSRSMAAHLLSIGAKDALLSLLCADPASLPAIAELRGSEVLEARLSSILAALKEPSDTFVLVRGHYRSPEAGIAAGTVDTSRQEGTIVQAFGLGKVSLRNLVPLSPRWSPWTPRSLGSRRGVPEDSVSEDRNEGDVEEGTHREDVSDGAARCTLCAAAPTPQGGLFDSRSSPDGSRLCSPAPERWNHTASCEFRKVRTGMRTYFLLPASTLLAEEIDIVTYLSDVDDGTDEDVAILRAEELRKLVVTVKERSETTRVVVASSAASPEVGARRILQRHKELEGQQCIQLFAESPDAPNLGIEPAICAALDAMLLKTDVARDTLTQVTSNMGLVRSTSDRLVALRQASSRQLIVNPGRHRRLSSLKARRGSDFTEVKNHLLAKIKPKLHRPSFFRKVMHSDAAGASDPEWDASSGDFLALSSIEVCDSVAANVDSDRALRAEADDSRASHPSVNEGSGSLWHDWEVALAIPDA